MDFGVSNGDLGKGVNNAFPYVVTFYVCFCGVIVGDDEVSEERFAGRDSEGDMIDTDTFPCRLRFLPKPTIVRHMNEICVQRYNIFQTYASFLSIYFEIPAIINNIYGAVVGDGAGLLGFHCSAHFNHLFRHLHQLIYHLIGLTWLDIS